MSYIESPRDLKTWAIGETPGDIATLAVVFTDIVGSTFMTHMRGEVVMKGIRTAHKAAVEPLYKAHWGYLVHDLGDGFLIVFRTVIDAFDFALELREGPGHPDINVHCGLAVGPVTVTPENVYGETVNLAARLEGAAKAQEIYVCGQSKAHIDTYRDPRHVNLPWRKTRPKLQGLPPRAVWVVTS